MTRAGRSGSGVSDKRKRAARAVMAETGMKYTAALREADRRHAEALSSSPSPGHPPAVSISEQHMALGKEMADAFAAGLRDPRPLTAQEMADLAAHAGGVARRSFPALYEDGET